LLAQLGSFGDCLYATSIARQIKIDNPECHLTWAIGSIYRSVLTANPDVDAIWEFSVECRNDLLDKWQEFEDIANQRKNAGEFDEVYFTQVFPNNIKNFDGTLRSSIFRGYSRPITVSVSPRIQLLPAEIENVANFIRQQEITADTKLILFECAAHSGQSFVTSQFALDVANTLIQQMPDVSVIMSSASNDLSQSDKRIIDGSVLSFRENAELTRYCVLVVGCSSGISWLCTSEWAKPLPMIQLLKKSTSIYASIVHDHEYFGLPTAHILEMTDCSANNVANCIEAVISNGIEAAKVNFHEKIEPNPYSYLAGFLIEFPKKRYGEAFTALCFSVKRYGIYKILGAFFILLTRINMRFLKKLF